MNSKSTPKDFFLHLGAVIALYSSVIAVLDLIFSIINLLFPDQLSGYFTTSGVAWPVSVLIIFVPVLYILEWIILKDIKENPVKKDVWIRRWRIYLTLFLTGLTIAIDLIVLTNVYLNGATTARFICKVVAVLVVSGVVFKYYFFSINEKYKLAKMAVKGNAWFGMLLVLASIVAGFALVGSPAKQRALRFDEQRVTDLQNIQYQVVNYWQHKGALPAVLSDINSSIAGTVIPNDPENATMYDYSIKDQKSFELCATFSQKSGTTLTQPTYPGDQSLNWKHDVGHTCFTRTIDPQMYPILTPPTSKVVQPY